MRPALSVTVIALLLASPASAQAPDSRVTASAFVGASQTWDDEGSLGKGVAGGARVDARLFGNTRAEAGLDLALHDRSGGFFEANGRTVLFSAALVQRFGRRTVQPYLLAGWLVAHHRGEVVFSGGPPQPRRSTDTGLVLGAGMAIRFKDRFELGPELRLIAIAPEDDIDPARAYLAGVRFGYRF